MYHIEVLPSSKDTATPGYAYVPDTGYDPSKAAIVPSSGSRKRARLAPSSSAFNNANDASSPSALTARQASKIAKHIADLDRDNHKDVQIAVLSKGSGVGGRVGTGAGKGMTPGVRKILQSQKAWANYLADEEAALAVAAAAARERGGAEGGVGSGTGASAASAGAGASATPRPLAVGAGRGRAKDPAKDGRRRKSTLKEVETVDEDEQAAQVQDQPTPMDLDAAAMPPPPLPSSTSNITTTASTAPAQPTSAAEDDDNDPLTRSNLPPLPTAAELQALLATPPLSYSASRAAPSTSTAPPRRFCEMCGYWGRAKCMKCGARVCGIECRDAHEETRCLKFYA